MSHTERADEILSFILPSIKQHKASRSAQQLPFILGLTGLQGSGKSTLAKHLVHLLKTEHGFGAIDISLDDFYKTHADRDLLRKSHPENKLLRVRGQPGTHDVPLAQKFFAQFTNSAEGESIEIPYFDKSLFSGDGDRAPRSEWHQCTYTTQQLDVIVFEGWCVGFRPLSVDAIERKKLSVQQSQSSNFNEEAKSTQLSTSTISQHRLEDLSFVNEHLSDYCELFMGPRQLDALVHLDTLDLVNVYKWRLQQEHMLLRLKGTSMTDEEVVLFIQGYMPSYELYLDGLRDGFFDSSDEKVQVHVGLDAARKVVDLKRL